MTAEAGSERGSHRLGEKGPQAKGGRSPGSCDRQDSPLSPGRSQPAHCWVSRGDPAGPLTSRTARGQAAFLESLGWSFVAAATGNPRHTLPGSQPLAVPQATACAVSPRRRLGSKAGYGRSPGVRTTSQRPGPWPQQPRVPARGSTCEAQTAHGQASPPRGQLVCSQGHVGSPAAEVTDTLPAPHLALWPRCPGRIRPRAQVRRTVSCAAAQRPESRRGANGRDGDEGGAPGRATAEVPTGAPTARGWGR